MIREDHLEDLGWEHIGKAYGDYYSIVNRFDVDDSTAYGEAVLQIAPARLRDDFYVRIIGYEYSRKNCDEEILFRGNISEPEELEILMKQIGII